MALTISVTDNADGTGATATVAGTGGAGVEVRTARVTGDSWPPPEWSDPPATRAGDGTVALSRTTGTYFAYAKTATDTTPPAFFGVTDPDELAVSTLCRDAVAARLALVSLPGCRKIHQETWREDANKDFPCVVLDVEGLDEREESGLDGLDHIAYPTRVSICDTLGLREKKKLRERYEPWRQRISDAFRWQKLEGVSDLFDHCVVEHLTIADPRNPQYSTFVSAVIVWSWCYKTRGI